MTAVKEESKAGVVWEKECLKLAFEGSRSCFSFWKNHRARPDKNNKDDITSALGGVKTKELHLIIYPDFFYKKISTPLKIKYKEKRGLGLIFSWLTKAPGKE